MMTDLSNEIVLIKNWDPKRLHSPIQEEIPTPVYLDDSIGLGVARPMAVSIPTTAKGKGDVFIDDVIKVFLARKENIERHTQSALLAIHVSMRPMSDQEPVPRKQPFSEEKAEAESVPKEEQIVLGWEIDTRRLVLRLPKQKFIAYSTDLSNFLKKGSISKTDLESLIGRLVHVSYVIPLSRNFLSRLRDKLKLIEISSRKVLQFNREEKADLELWDKLLLQARNGISLNGLTLRNPTRLGFSDSCPRGLGGYTHGGRGWRLAIDSSSPIFDDDSANNALEFLGLAITTWLSIMECDSAGLTNELILVLSDNTSAITWVYKSSLSSKSHYRKS